MQDPQDGVHAMAHVTKEQLETKADGEERVQSPESDLATPLASETSTLHKNGEPSHDMTDGMLSPTAMILDDPFVGGKEADSEGKTAVTPGRSDHTLDTPIPDYFALPKSTSHPRLTPGRAAIDQTSNFPTRISSSSLQADAEKGFARGHMRTSSLRSSGSDRAKRSPSATKFDPLNKSSSNRSLTKDHPVYPEQSLASLQSQFHVIRPSPPIRTRSSHPAGTNIPGDMASPKLSIDRSPGRPTSITADNTPISSPGLFKLGSGGENAAGSERGQLHHLQTPKETHTAEIDHDVYSGNKYINKYEIIEEIGRGEHGKVKLGRHLETAQYVAVKIVPRYSVRRRLLANFGAPEDRTKREVAILKKAAHKNVVALFEVIDDPSKNKVYLILEFVEKGEIKWRKQGVPEILAINNARFEKEKHGISITTAPQEREIFSANQALRRHEFLEKARAAQSGNIPVWSLEHGFDEDDEDSVVDLSRSQSRSFLESNIPSRSSSKDDYRKLESALAGTMYGSYMPEIMHNRKFSMAMSQASHMSSEVNFGENDDEHGYVPALTLEEARRAFRDTLTGLDFLKEIGIIHRDIKPANLLVTASGMVKISDFGVSYLGRSTSEEDPENKVLEEDAEALYDEKELARSVGTPAFWAPEMCYEDASMFSEQPPKITGALDLWALGITLYCMIYARLPFYATDEMGLHEAVCTAEVFTPKTRLVPVDTTRDLASAMTSQSIEPGKRSDYELKFEEVPEAARDLIKRLLIKDPAHRMTIPEAKRHPWVLEGLENVEQWIKAPTIEKETKIKILHVNDKEMSHAVVKRNFIERTVAAAKIFTTNLLGRGNSRKRASSNATPISQSSDSLQSPQGSNASTVGKSEKLNHNRRTSIRGDELVNALKASRDGVPHEHPLAQSQTASPVDSDHETPFDDVKVNVKAASHSATPSYDSDHRPRAPDRAVSAISAAESVRTIRASQVQKQLLQSIPHDVEATPSVEPKSKMTGLWEGTAKHLGRFRSQDRSSRGSHDRSRGSSRHSSESDARAVPSLAVSTAMASGAMATPDVLRTTMSPTEYSSDSTSPRVVPDSRRLSSFIPPASSEEAFEHAQDINQRRLIQESQYSAQAAAEAVPRGESHTETTDCPPSPDDITFLQKQMEQDQNPSPSSIAANDSKRGMLTAPSESTIASSIDDFGDSSVSQSMSHPSFGMISGASSPPVEAAHIEGKDLVRGSSNSAVSNIEPDFMRTADTIIPHDRAGHEVRSAKPLELWTQEDYDDQADYDAGFDNSSEDGEDDDDDDDDGLVMKSGPARRL